MLDAPAAVKKSIPSDLVLTNAKGRSGESPESTASELPISKNDRGVMGTNILVAKHAHVFQFLPDTSKIDWPRRLSEHKDLFGGRRAFGFSSNEPNLQGTWD